MAGSSTSIQSLAGMLIECLVQLIRVIVQKTKVLLAQLLPKIVRAAQIVEGAATS
jgi:hypothetical protein